MARSTDGTSSSTTTCWYTCQLLTGQLKTEYGVDDIEIMKYFPLDSTIQGTFDVYQELFQLKFKQLEKVDAWHPDVKQYEVTDATNDKFLGSFYLDLHPRDGKYGHAAVFPLQSYDTL